MFQYYISQIDLKSKIEEAPATSVLTILVLYGFIIQIFIIILFGEKVFAFLFAVDGITNPRPAWVLHLFAHLNPLHLLMNIALFPVYGWAIESELGSRLIIVVFFLAGVPSGVIHATITGGAGGGASGAIFGLMMFCVPYYFNGSDDTSNRFLFVLAVCAVLSLPVQLLVDVLILDGINYSHIGGAFIGFSIGGYKTLHT